MTSTVDHAFNPTPATQPLGKRAGIRRAVSDSWTMTKRNMAHVVRSH